MKESEYEIKCEKGELDRAISYAKNGQKTLINRFGEKLLITANLSNDVIKKHWEK